MPTVDESSSRGAELGFNLGPIRKKDISGVNNEHIMAENGLAGECPRLSD